MQKYCLSFERVGYPKIGENGGWKHEMNKLCVDLGDSWSICGHANIYNNAIQAVEIDLYSPWLTKI